MMTKLGYAASVGRLSRGDIVDARHRLGQELDGRDDPEGRAHLIGFCDRLTAAFHDRDALELIGEELRVALRTWARPDPVDIHRRDIYG
ncbi:hypothetical protein [Roseicyclus amphidinii]|uniref:hypothetical protein n=1 Tax=Roseicyclus amphidinii TaxID=3034232 RepID=UPI0024E135C6|nr:hypothetical protein [Roseicyclus sp. Amp-Y-6]